MPWRDNARLHTIDAWGIDRYYVDYVKASGSAVCLLQETQT